MEGRGTTDAVCVGSSPTGSAIIDRVLDGFEGAPYKRVHKVQLFGGQPFYLWMIIVRWWERDFKIKFEKV